jgi:hypothetical protein
VGGRVADNFSFGDGGGRRCGLARHHWLSVAHCWRCEWLAVRGSHLFVVFGGRPSVRRGGGGKRRKRGREEER